MKSNATTVEEYLQELPADRRTAISAVRKVILANLPKGYVECMGYGMIGYVVPHSLFPAGYHCDPKLPLPFANLGSQKNHMSLHVMTIYGDPATEKWFRKAWQATGKKLDMGKCCVRFKKLEDVALDVIGQVIARVSVKDYIARVEKIMGATTKQGGKSKPKKSHLHKKEP
ncbi:MAG: DUF1801 domain-containing protein [Limisphaerales bacterium]